MKKKKNYSKQYETARNKVLNEVNEMEMQGFHFNKLFRRSIEKMKSSATKSDVSKMKKLFKKEALYKRATSYTYQKEDGKHVKVSVKQGRQMRTQQARRQAKESYKENLENVIMSIPDNYYLYERKQNGQFYVYPYNVEDDKWKCLDIIDGMQDVKKKTINEVQEHIDYVESISPSELNEQDIESMFSKILAILNGGRYNNSSYGRVSSIGTPFEDLSNDEEGFEI